MLAAPSSLYKPVLAKAEDIMVAESSFEEMGQPKVHDYTYHMSIKDKKNGHIVI